MPKTDFVVKLLKTLKGYNTYVGQSVKILSAGDGSCKALVKVDEAHSNSVGTLHGGFSASLVDVISTVGLSTHSKADNKIHVSVNINIEYIGAAKIGEEVIVDTKTVKAGRSLAFLSVEIRKKNDDSLVVKATHLKMLLDKKT